MDQIAQPSAGDVGESVPPDPSQLIESIRGFGYSLPAALADLIDNSLTAGSRKVGINIDLLDERPHIAISDDGTGMDEATLVEAMRMGTMGPLATRDQDDLGRFGLGLKSAALSQGRVLTVITRCKDGGPLAIRRWDLHHVARSKAWELLRTPASAAMSYVGLLGIGTGTVVVIEDLDRNELTQLTEGARAHFVGRLLKSVRDHLSMTFHRFIAEDGVAIRLGQAAIPAWDPFLAHHSAVQPTETFRLTEGTIQVTPYLLPHHSKLDASEAERTAGPYGWHRHQGFYVYRCRRLIVPGSWLSIGLSKSEQTRLARIQVDLPNTMDSAWQLNVMKSQVTIPAPLRESFRRIGEDVSRSAMNVFGYRGERSAPSETASVRAVWRRVAEPQGVRYRVDRAHPLVAAVLNGGRAEPDTVERLLSVIERAIPVAAILQESSRSLDAAAGSPTREQLAELAELFRFAEQHFVRAGLSPQNARHKVLDVSPFCDVRSELLTILEPPDGVQS